MSLREAIERLQRAIQEVRCGHRTEMVVNRQAGLVTVETREFVPRDCDCPKDSGETAER